MTKAWIVHACALALIAGCAANKPSGETIHEQLVGTWCEPDSTGRTCIGYMVYYADGTYYAYGELQQFDMEYESWGDWAVEGHEACITPGKRVFTSLSSGAPIDPEVSTDAYCQQVEDIDDAEALLSRADGRQLTILRVSAKPDETFQPGARVPGG